MRMRGRWFTRHAPTRSFFDTQMPAESMDAVLSQDAFSHASTEHHRAIEEAARVLKPGGLMAFTDLMQTGNADPAKLAEVRMIRPPTTQHILLRLPHIMVSRVVPGGEGGPIMLEELAMHAQTCGKHLH